MDRSRRRHFGHVASVAIVGGFAPLLLTILGGLFTMQAENAGSRQKEIAVIAAALQGA